MFLIGACFGSFFNVCIFRLPTAQNLSLPGSYCYSCGAFIKWYDNIPILSYFILGGRCRSCQSSFSIRYALIELLTALLFVAIFLQYGFTWALPTYLVFTGLLLICTFTDIDTWIIPDRISLGGAAAGVIMTLLISFFAPIEPADWIVAHAGPFPPGSKSLHTLIDEKQMHEAIHGDEKQSTLTLSPQAGLTEEMYRSLHERWPWWGPVLNSLIGALVGSTVLWGIGYLGSIVFRKPAMGFGDVKLLMLIGAFTGWYIPILSIFLASITGTVYGVGVLVYAKLKRSKVSKKQTRAATHEEIENLLSDESDDARQRGWVFSPREKSVLTRLLSTPAGTTDFSPHHLPFGPHLALAAFVLMLFEPQVTLWLEEYFSPILY